MVLLYIDQATQYSRLQVWWWAHKASAANLRDIRYCMDHQGGWDHPVYARPPERGRGVTLQQTSELHLVQTNL